MSQLTEFMSTARGINTVVFLLGQAAGATWIMDVVSAKTAGIIAWTLLTVASTINVYVYGNPKGVQQ